MDILGVIPARFASTRFPGKPLALINGKPMIQHVYNRCLESKQFKKIIVATDDQRIVDAVEVFGGEAVWTSDKHVSGTNRCFEVLEKQTDAFDAIINIQGDEPFIHPSSIIKVADLLEDNAEIATLALKVTKASQLTDINKVKVVLNKQREAMYFSRAAIPYQRDAPVSKWIDNADYFVHLGIYGFNVEVVKKIKELEESKLEQLECLEQLRWLEANHKIVVGQVNEDSLGVDTPEDLERLNKLISIRGNDFH